MMSTSQYSITPIQHTGQSCMPAWGLDISPYCPCSPVCKWGIQSTYLHWLVLYDMYKNSAGETGKTSRRNELHETDKHTNGRSERSVFVYIVYWRIRFIEQHERSAASPNCPPPSALAKLLGWRHPQSQKIQNSITVALFFTERGTNNTNMFVLISPYLSRRP